MKKFTAIISCIFILMVTVMCKEEETIDYFSITGKITASESVSANELVDIEIFLGLLHDTVNVQNITTKSNIDFLIVKKTSVDVNGSYSLKKLDYGNYILRPEPGFMFVPDTFIVVNIDGVRKNQFLRGVEKFQVDYRWD